MQKVRKPYIDYLKGIAAGFVVIGHCITYFTQNYSYAHSPFWLSLLGVLVSSVHVPMFFLIAGYLCHQKPYVQHVKQKVLRVLIPYYSFSILKLLYSLIVNKNFAHGSSLIEILYDMFILGGSYWFIYCMFIIYLLAPIGWVKNCEESKNKNRVLIIICMSLFILNVATQDLKIYAFPDEWNILGFQAKTPLFQIERVCIYFPYFIIGMLIQNNNERAIRFLRQIRPVIICFLFFIALFIGSLVAIGVIKKGFAFKAIIAFSLMLFLYRIMLKIPDGVNALSVPGKYSLHVMFFDSFYRVMIFAIIAHFVKINAGLTLIIAALDIIISCYTSYLLARIPIIRIPFGLSDYYKK